MNLFSSLSIMFSVDSNQFKLLYKYFLVRSQFKADLLLLNSMRLLSEACYGNFKHFYSWFDWTKSIDWWIRMRECLFDTHNWSEDQKLNGENGSVGSLNDYMDEKIGNRLRYVVDVVLICSFICRCVLPDSIMINSHHIEMMLLLFSSLVNANIMILWLCLLYYYIIST